MEPQTNVNSVVVASPDSGQQISLGGTLHNFKLKSGDTSGQFALMEGTVNPGVLVIPHLHTHEDELMIGVEGQVGLRVGDQEFKVGPGTYVFIPRGTPHAMWNSSDQPAKGITIFSPGGLENYFAEMGAVFQASIPPDFAKLGMISHQFGIVTNMEWVPELSAKYGVKMS